MNKYFSVCRKLGKMHILRRICNNRETQGGPFYKSQYEYIKFISENPGCTQAYLAEKMLISPPSAALSVKRMEKAGLIKREADKDNLRCNKLYCTEKAIASAEKCHSIMAEIDKNMFEGFSDTELKEFETYVERILDNIVNKYFDGKSPDKQEAFLLIKEMEESNK